MTPEQFVYWLQGFVEVSKPETWHRADFSQHENKIWEQIKNHLDLVLTKKTPLMSAHEARDLFKPAPTSSPFIDWDKQRAVPQTDWPHGTLLC